jgi:hypothetical protein
MEPKERNFPDCTNAGEAIKEKELILSEYSIFVVKDASFNAMICDHCGALISSEYKECAGPCNERYLLLPIILSFLDVNRYCDETCRTQALYHKYICSPKLQSLYDTLENRARDGDFPYEYWAIKLLGLPIL